MKPRLLLDVGATLTLAMGLPIASIGATLSGTVKDLGELKSRASGVKGVTVVVVGPGEQELRAGTTAPDGTYRIDNLPLRIALKAVFDKLYYEERHKAVPVELTGDATTLDVFLSKDSEDAAYNSRVAESLAQQAGAGDYRSFSLLTAGSVRASQRLALRRELEKRMQPQALELALARSVGDQPLPSTKMAAGPGTTHDSWDSHFQVINDSSNVIRELYVSNVDERDWQEDVLGSRVLLPGHSIRINVDDGTRHCHYDFKAVVQGGGNVFRWNVDVCAVSALTLSD